MSFVEEYKDKILLGSLAAAATLIKFPEYLKGYEVAAPISLIVVAGVIFLKYYKNVKVQHTRVASQPIVSPVQMMNVPQQNIVPKNKVMQEWNSSQPVEVDFHEKPKFDKYVVDESLVAVKNMDVIKAEREVRKKQMQDEIEAFLKKSKSVAEEVEEKQKN